MQIYRLLNFFDYKLYSCDRGVKDRSLLRVRKKNSKFFGGPPLVWAVALWIDYLKLFEVAGLPNILINYNELYLSQREQPVALHFFRNKCSELRTDVWKVSDWYTIQFRSHSSLLVLHWKSNLQVHSVPAIEWCNWTYETTNDRKKWITIYRNVRVVNQHTSSLALVITCVNWYIF
jgi:hypothetical protein